MKKLLTILCLTSLLIAGCSEKQTTPKDPVDNEGEDLKDVKGLVCVVEQLIINSEVKPTPQETEYFHIKVEDEKISESWVKKLKSEIGNGGIKLHKVYVKNNTNTSTPEKDKSIFPEQNVSTKNIQLGYGDGYVLPNGGITSQILRLIQQQNGNHHQKREISMISQILKSNKPEVYELVMKNNSAKALLKQIDGIWKRRV